MCEMPKPEGENSKQDDDIGKPRSYYYDDAHGYEDFDPESDEIDPEEEEESS